MSYAEIDRALEIWATAKGVRLLFEYKDEEVRSFIVTSPTGETCQVWIDPPNQAGIGIHVWRPPSQRLDLVASRQNLAGVLEQAHREAEKLLNT